VIATPVDLRTLYGSPYDALWEGTLASSYQVWSTPSPLSGPDREQGGYASSEECSNMTPRMHEAHITIGHIACGLVEEWFVSGRE